MLDDAKADGTILDHPVDVPTDEELCALALAADPETEVGDDAVSLWELTGDQRDGPLPSWYMPAPAGRLLTGWKRVPPVLIVGSLLFINGCGLCITYGKLGLI